MPTHKVFGRKVFGAKCSRAQLCPFTYAANHVRERVLVSPMQIKNIQDKTENDWRTQPVEMANEEIKLNIQLKWERWPRVGRSSSRSCAQHFGIVDKIDANEISEKMLHPPINSYFVGTKWKATTTNILQNNSQQNWTMRCFCLRNQECSRHRSQSNLVTRYFSQEILFFRILFLGKTSDIVLHLLIWI